MYHVYTYLFFCIYRFCVFKTKDSNSNSIQKQNSLSTLIKNLQGSNRSPLFCAGEWAFRWSAKIRLLGQIQKRQHPTQQRFRFMMGKGSWWKNINLGKWLYSFIHSFIQPPRRVHSRNPCAPHPRRVTRPAWGSFHSWNSWICRRRSCGPVGISKRCPDRAATNHSWNLLLRKGVK